MPRRSVALASSSGDPTASAAGAQLLYVLGGSLWDVGAVFFGLWLIPMGFLTLRSGVPRPLGWIPATVGEFWMIGWLLWHASRARVATS